MTLGAKPIERVPGAVLVVQHGQPECIVWPSGLRTEMQFFPIMDKDHLEAYRIEPIQLRSKWR